MTPQKLRKRLLQEIRKTKKQYEHIICLYGDCFPNIDDFCEHWEVTKVPGHYCYEMLLGSEKFQQLIDDMAGTYFVEKDLLFNFWEYCVRPLELEDKEMRDYYFQQYQRVVYVRQPADPNLVLKAEKVAKLLGLNMDISDADYTHLEKNLMELL